MKRTKNFLLAGAIAILCCSIGKAQTSYYSNSLAGATLIYSNAFDGGDVDITDTPPDYAVSSFGGNNNAVWLDAWGVDSNAFFANGTVSCVQEDSIILPFTPQSNQVYTLNATVDFYGNPGSWVCGGFVQHYQTYALGSAGFNQALGGLEWALLNYGGNSQYFTKTTQLASKNGAFTSPGPVTMTFILDTTSNRWTQAYFVNGTQLGNTYTYSSPPTIAGLGLGQHSLGAPQNYQWTGLTLSAAQLVISQEPASGSANEGSAYTNSVVVGGTPPFFYQWYTNGAPISGATNASLILPSVSPGNAGNDYYVVVTNSAYGAVTSTPASLIVYTRPEFSSTIPITYTNPMTLYGGTNYDGTNYLGSNPTFSVVATGVTPITYQWLTNGVAVGGATNTSFTFTNCQLSSPTNFTCIASNSLGAATNVWGVQYVPIMAPFPQAVLALNPIGYWRMNDTNLDGPDNGGGDDGYICDDYAGGNDGIYTNCTLGFPGYNPTGDPSDSSVQFGEESTTDFGDSMAYGIAGINFGSPANTSAAFTVSAWVSGYQQNSDAGIVTLGYGNGGEQFDLDCGSDSAPTSHGFRFLFRDASGTVHSVSSTVMPSTVPGAQGPWHFLAAVVDEVNSKTVSLYIDGQLVGTASVPAGAGILSSTNLMSIGSRMSSMTSSFDDQFTGNMNDVAIYNQALSGAQILNLYEAGGGRIPLSFGAPVPPTNVAYQVNTTVTIPATVSGQPPVGYYWTNLTTGAVLESGATNVLAPIDATLTIPDISGGLSGDQLELVATNASGSTNLFVTLFNPPPPVTLSYTNSILYTNEFYGGAWTIAGMPVTAANSLVGGTNTTWTDALGTNDTGMMQASGVDASTMPDSWVLPFTPHAGYVYTLTASLTFSGNPGNWVGLGFAQNVPNNAANGYGRFSDGGSTPPQEGPEGYDWMILTESSGNVQAFGGPGGQNQLLSQNGFFTAGPGTHTVQVVLDTTGAQWTMAAYVDGVQAGTNYVYSANPPIGAVGITQNTLTTPGYLQWNYITLSQVAPSLSPYFFTQPSSTNVASGSTLTVSPIVLGTLPISYQWYETNVAASTGYAIAGQTNADLVINNISAGGSYYLSATNLYGSTNSATINVAVYSSPLIIGALPVTYTNLYTLYAGANPSYSVSALGLGTVSYHWYTNGMPVAGAVSSNLTLTGVSAGLLTNMCVVSNYLGTATNIWTAQVLPVPSAPYPQSVMALNPIGYWRMNDTNLDGPDNGGGDDGYVCDDYAGGNDGIYTNCALGFPGYNPTEDPSDSSAQFGEESTTDFGDSLSYGVAGINFGSPTNTSVAFTVEAWVSGYQQTSDAGLVTLGWGGGGEQFNLDCGSDGSPTVHGFRFFFRDASGAFHGVSSTVMPSAVPGQEGPWYHLVGVVDEINSHTVSFYVNGQLVGTASAPSGAGVLSSSDLMGIGSRSSSATTNFDDQFGGNINDVAVFNYALTASQVANEYDAGGGTIAPYFTPAAPTNGSAAANTTLTIPVTVVGTPPLTYYWTNLTTSAEIASGTANNGSGNVSLSYGNVPSSWNGDQLELTVSNAYGMTNALLTLAITNSVNANPTNLVFAVTNNQLSLSWPTDHTGWQLQAQTNSLGVGLSTNWVNFNPSTGTNHVVIPINLTNGAVFYRLIYSP